MKYISKLIILLLIAFDIVLFLWILLHGHALSVLDPKGLIALKERNLILIAVSLGFLIIVPVLIILFSIAWKYREGNTKTKYAPDAVNTRWDQSILWVIPIIVMCILAVITWKTTHELDPYKPIVANAKPLTIQVIALRWKWLFIYPDQHIATVNYIRFPIHTPVNIELTADDAPMNSFWIPGLVGQMYAMTGMKTQLHFLSDTPGKFTGSAAEISGQGFAGMRFVAEATSEIEFNTWVQSVQQSSKPLDTKTYSQLLIPSENSLISMYAPVEKDLYNTIIMKYMEPAEKKKSMDTMQEMK
ncbi:MAG TPA: COX aromatic rich motif-containing protein [Candidatus Saccharimonadales bacterium]|nr:COX aromatic rich motif-containing protein [Candidatus Saccharimonadales bacterium]